MPAINQLIWESVKPILKLALVAACGVLLTRAGLFPVSGTRTVSQIILNITLPSLLFAKIVPSFNQQNIQAIGPIVVVALTYMVVSLIMGLFVRTTCKTPRNFRYGIISAAVWSNWGDLPTSVVQTVASQSPFSGTADADLAIAYVAIFILVFYVTLFPLGGTWFISRDYVDVDKGVEGGEVEEVSEKSGRLAKFKAAKLRKLRHRRKGEASSESHHSAKSHHSAESPQLPAPTPEFKTPIYHDAHSQLTPSTATSLYLTPAGEGAGTLSPSLSGVSSGFQSVSQSGAPSRTLSRLSTQAPDAARVSPVLPDTASAVPSAATSPPLSRVVSPPLSGTSSTHTAVPLTGATSDAAPLSHVRSRSSTLHAPTATAAAALALQRVESNMSHVSVRAMAVGPAVASTDSTQRRRESMREIEEIRRFSRSENGLRPRGNSMLKSEMRLKLSRDADSGDEFALASDSDPDSEEETELAREVRQEEEEEKERANVPETRLRRYARPLWRFVVSLFTPPTISLITAIVCALVDKLKALFVYVDGASFNPTAPDGDPPLAVILDTTSFIGAASVPLGLLLLGSALARMKLPRPISRLPIASIVGIACAKLVILPVFGYFFVKALADHTTFVDKDNHVLVFVLTYFSCVPAATTQVALTQIFAPEDGENNSDILAAYLMMQYAIYAFSSVILTAVTLNGF